MPGPRSETVAAVAPRPTSSVTFTSSAAGLTRSAWPGGCRARRRPSSPPRREPRLVEAGDADRDLGLQGLRLPDGVHDDLVELGRGVRPRRDAVELGEEEQVAPQPAPPRRLVDRGQRARTGLGLLARPPRRSSTCARMVRQRRRWRGVGHAKRRWRSTACSSSSRFSRRGRPPGRRSSSRGPRWSMRRARSRRGSTSRPAHAPPRPQRPPGDGAGAERRRQDGPHGGPQTRAGASRFSACRAARSGAPTTSSAAGLRAGPTRAHASASGG